MARRHPLVPHRRGGGRRARTRHRLARDDRAHPPRRCRVLGTLGLLVPFAAYSIAERLGGSGVLAVVAAGILIGYHAPRTSYTTRAAGAADLAVGRPAARGSRVRPHRPQLSPAVADVLGSDLGFGTNLALAFAAFGAVIVVRVARVFGGYAVSRRLGTWIAPRRARCGRAPTSNRGSLRRSSPSSRGRACAASSPSRPRPRSRRSRRSHRGQPGLLVAFVVTVGSCCCVDHAAAAHHAPRRGRRR